MTKAQCATAALTGLLAGLLIVAVAIAGALSLPVFLALLFFGGTLSVAATTTEFVPRLVIPRLADLDLSLSVFGLRRTEPWLADMQMLQRRWALDVVERLEEMRELVEEARHLGHQTSAMMDEIQARQSGKAPASADPEIVERPDLSSAREYVEQLGRGLYLERVGFETRVRTARRLAETARWLQERYPTDPEIAELAATSQEVELGAGLVVPASTKQVPWSMLALHSALLTHSPADTDVISILQSTVERIAESQTDAILSALTKDPLTLEKLSEAVPDTPDLSLRLVAFEEEGLIEEERVWLPGTGIFSAFSLTEAGAELAYGIHILKAWVARRDRESEQQGESSSSDAPH